MRRGTGTVYKRGETYWIQYFDNGRRIRESADTSSEAAAEKLLRTRLAAVDRGIPVGPEVTRTTFAHLMETYREYLEVNGKRTRNLPFEVAHLEPVFGRDLARQITTERLTKYTLARLAEGAAAGTVNRELTTLRAAMRLAQRNGRLVSVPYFPLLAVDNVRKGFIEWSEMQEIARHLPEHMQAPALVCYITGWRTGEVLSRQRKHYSDGWLRLEPGETKNKAGRMFPVTDQLKTILDEASAPRAGRIVPWLFHRDGAQIRRFDREWRAACAAAGYPGRIPHDMRRSAVRNLERSGVSRSAAMALTGHKTESVYRRYAIVDESDLIEAARKVQEARNG